MLLKDKPFNFLGLTSLPLRVFSLKGKFKTANMPSRSTKQTKSRVYVQTTGRNSSYFTTDHILKLHKESGDPLGWAFFFFICINYIQTTLHLPQLLGRELFAGCCWLLFFCWLFIFCYIRKKNDKKGWLLVEWDYITDITVPCDAKAKHHNNHTAHHISALFEKNRSLWGKRCTTREQLELLHVQPYMVFLPVFASLSVSLGDLILCNFYPVHTLHPQTTLHCRKDI